MPDTSEHKTSIAVLFFSNKKKKISFPLPISIDPATVLNINDTLYTALLALIHIFFFGFSQKLTVYSALYLAKKSLV